MSAKGEERGVRRLDGVMAAAALVALGLLLMRYGLRVGAEHDATIGVIDVVCVLVFAGAQAAKLLVVAHPTEYFRSRRFDFSLLLVVAVQALVHFGLRSTPEAAWLDRHGAPEPLWPLFVLILQAYFIGVVLFRSPLVPRLLLRLRLRPVQILVVSFLLLIAGGTLLLALPGSAADGRASSWIDALFTATSAVCVTGLVVWDTGTHFSPLGLVFLAVLIQAGGLGMLTITGSFALFGGEGLRGEEARVLARALDVGSEADMRRTLRTIVLTTFAVEAVGAAALFWAWRGELGGGVKAAAWAGFHAVSAFCNAGFSLFAGNASLTGHAADASTLVPIGALIVAGGLGFGVLATLGRRALGRGGGPDRHGRWVLVGSVVLIVVGMVAFYYLERAGALAALGPGVAWGNALFQSITLRTAGFNAVDLAGLALPAVVLCVAWMLVGGAPGGTAGGVKVTTAAVGVVSLFRRHPEDSALRRRAGMIVLLFFGAFSVTVALLSLAQHALDRRIVFEAASALGTVGLSMGVTGELGAAGKLVVCLAMFIGRVGPFALAASALSHLERDEPIPPERRISLG